MTIVNEAGFAEDDWTGPYVNWTECGQEPCLTGHATAVDIPNSLSGEELVAIFDRIVLVRIDFPSHTDGRGFTLARRLRRLGYRGRIRARGHIVADQYAMARRCGFDEIEIDASLARRQPAELWCNGEDWRTESYQSRLKGTRSG